MTHLICLEFHFSLTCENWEIIPKIPSSFDLAIILWFKLWREIKSDQGNVGSPTTPLNTVIIWLISSLWNKPSCWKISVVREKTYQMGTKAGDTVRVKMRGQTEKKNCSISDCNSLSVWGILRAYWIFLCRQTKVMIATWYLSQKLEINDMKLKMTKN